MVDILLLQTVSILVTSAGLLVAALYYVLQIRHQTKIRQTDLVMRLYSTWGSKEFRDMLMEDLNLQFKDYEDFVKKYGPWLSKGPAQTAISAIAMYFGGIGFLLYKKIIDVDFIYNLIGFLPVKLHWEKMKPIVSGLREQYNSPSMFGWFEYLYNEMKKYAQQQAGVKSG